MCIHVYIVKLLQSLRRDLNADEEAKIKKELEVTPQFQNYVALHLDKVLEKQIKEVRLKMNKLHKYLPTCLVNLHMLSNPSPALNCL